MTAAPGNDKNHNDDNQITYRCTNCRRPLAADERRCPRCGSDGTDIVSVVNERIRIKEDAKRILIRKLEKVECNLLLLLITLAIAIGTPIIFYGIGLADLGSIISVAAGLVATYLGFRAITKVREIHKSAG
jgi:hypothetical protein